jgi:hypothetical protein
MHSRVGGSIGLAFLVAGIDENRLTAGVLAGFNVSPAITDHETCRKIYLVAAGCCEQETGFWLSARAIVAVGVIAHKNIVDGNRIGEPPVNGFDSLPG